jgi:hypothetical protein
MLEDENGHSIFFVFGIQPLNTKMGFISII